MRFLAKKCENIAKSRQKMIPDVCVHACLCVCLHCVRRDMEIRKLESASLKVMKYIITAILTLILLNKLRCHAYV